MTPNAADPIEQMDSESNAIPNFTGRIERASHRLGNQVGSAAKRFTERAGDYADTTKTYVQQKPFQSLVLAAVTGAAVGTLFSMVSHRRH